MNNDCGGIGDKFIWNVNLNSLGAESGGCVSCVGFRI